MALRVVDRTKLKQCSLSYCEVSISQIYTEWRCVLSWVYQRFEFQHASNCGCLWRSQICTAPNEYGARTLRPLLADVTKAELRSFLEAVGQPWREDASNLDPGAYKRNRLRLEALPALTALAGGPRPLAARLAVMAQQSRSLRTWLEAEATRWESLHLPPGQRHLPLEPWAALPEPVRTEALHRFVARSAGDRVGSAHLAQLQSLLDAGSLEWAVHVPGAEVQRRGSVLRCRTFDSAPRSASGLPSGPSLSTAGDAVVEGVVVKAAALAELNRRGLTLTTGPVENTVPGGLQVLLASNLRHGLTVIATHSTTGLL